MDEGLEQLGLLWGELDAQDFESVVVEEVFDVVFAALIVEVDETQLVDSGLVDLGAEV